VDLVKDPVHAAVGVPSPQGWLLGACRLAPHQTAGRDRIAPTGQALVFDTCRGFALGTVTPKAMVHWPEA